MPTVKDVFLNFASQYKEEYRPSIRQMKALRDITTCRTEQLGGRVYECDECGDQINLYNSCRNRHCPTGQGINKEIWVDERKKDILNVPYFHVVFTMPKEIQQIIYHNQKALYSLMYKCVAQTLSELSMDKKHLGAQIGFFSILHTWGEDLRYHPHIHTVVLAGGLTKQKRWVSSSEKFFIPIKILSKVFRGKFLHYFKKYYHKGTLNFYGDAKKYKDPEAFQELIDDCYAKKWYSFSRRTFSGPEAVIRYLGRYTHRIAIANERIVSMNKEFVTFKVKNQKDKAKTVTLKGVEFIRRFLMHILPKGFVKVRYYGLLANINRKTKLALSRRLTRSQLIKPSFEGLKKIEILSQLLGRDVRLCPTCKDGKFNTVEMIPKQFPP